MKEMSKAFEQIKDWFIHGFWSEKRVRDAVKMGKITQQECDMILSMSSLIKRHRRLYHNSIILRFNPMKQRCYMSVIPDIISTTPIDWNSCYRCNPAFQLSDILDFYIHKFYIML